MPPKLLRIVFNQWGIVSGHSARSWLFTILVLFGTHRVPTLVQFSLHSVACLVALEFRDASCRFCIIYSDCQYLCVDCPSFCDYETGVGWSWTSARMFVGEDFSYFQIHRVEYVCGMPIWLRGESIPYHGRTTHIRSHTFQQTRERACQRHFAKFNNYTMLATSPRNSVIKIKTEVDFEWERFDVNSKCSELRDSPQKNCE